MTAQPLGAAPADQRVGKGSCDLRTTAGHRASFFRLLHGSLGGGGGGLGGAQPGCLVPARLEHDFTGLTLLQKSFCCIGG